jgi:hypothetical protein
VVVEEHEPDSGFDATANLSSEGFQTVDPRAVLKASLRNHTYLWMSSAALVVGYSRALQRRGDLRKLRATRNRIERTELPWRRADPQSCQWGSSLS